MTRAVLIFGLIFVAAFLPAAVLPLTITLVGTLIFLAAVTLFVRADVQPVALRATARLRAPPPR